ncbi:hypothetical protein C8A05DRAFT_34371 [Staphylotrichum tortipilum]|uniref:Uncharacterized protein n=1 Tax=Staphylotrichum tortipilum TaxID=2831512 RepID=A0AAN6RT17_9PEZI|nr:hypothetical protein C8A05DRAFT_34371 [Staphylotrichum longicolle]
MEARHFFTKTAGPRDDLLRREKNQADEGRLSYDDEVDDDPQSPLPESQVFGSPAEGKMDVDDLVRPRSENANGAAPATEDESLEFEVLEMIQTESKKTDLLFLVNGVEHMSACDPTVVKLFEGQENIFINGALGKARPRPTDFYELRDEGEREVGEMDCEGVHEKPADTKAEEARMAAMNGLTICPALVGGADSGMSSPEHASAAEVAAAAGLVILARACLPTESAPFNQMETESIEIRAAPDRLDDQIPIEGVTEPATAEEAVDKSPENKVVACEVAFLKASRQDATDFSGAQCQDDTAMEVEESAAPTSGPVDKATDGDMAGPESLPVATEMSSSDSTPRSISPMANVQTSPCPGLVEEAASSETTSFESSPAAGDPTTPCRVLGEALGSDTAACGTVAEAEKPTSPKRIADETPCSESVEPASTSAAEISVCQNICVETPASEKARLEITPQSQDPTVPCQPLVGEAPESDKSDIGISPVATPPTPSCRSGAKETSVVESDKVVDPLLAVLDAVLAEQTTPVPEPGHDSELPPAVQAVPAKEATGPQPGQDAETPKDVQAVLPEEGLASMPGQEAEFPKVLQAAHLNEPSQGDEAPSKPAPGSEVSQAMAG